MTKITLCLFANKIYSMTGSRFMPCRQFRKLRAHENIIVF